MRYILSISLIALLLINCDSTPVLKHKHIVWESIVKGNVEAIYQSRYTQNQDLLLHTEVDGTTDELFLELSDSTIAFFSEDKRLTSNKTFCNEELDNHSFSPCSERLIEYDKKNRLKGSEYVDLLSDYKTYNKVKKYDEQQFPSLIEMVDEQGNAIGLTHYEFNQDGLVTKRISEYKNPDLKTIITNEYNQAGLVIKVTSQHDNRQADEKDLPISKENLVSVVYEYLEFDEKGNWTKRKEINSKSALSYSYRTYQYFD